MVSNLTILFCTSLTFAAALGTNLPKGITAQQIIRLIAPQSNDSLATLVGCKKWPHRPNTFIAIACFSPDLERFEHYFLYAHENKACACKGGYGNGNVGGYIHKQVFLAMLEYTDTLKILASCEEAIDIKISWENSQLNHPNFLDNENDSIYPDTYSSFDFAKYQIRDDQIAFGVRVSWNEGYAGGGEDFGALLLFADFDGNLLNILSEPMHSSQLFAGEWNDDGTRMHTEEEGKNIVIIQKTKTDGYYDIVIKESGGKWKKRFVWSTARSRYLPGN